MKTDTLGRRKRWEPPHLTEDDAEVYPQEADYLAWEAINRHGPLPLPIIALYGKELRRNYKNYQKRYGRFYVHGWVTRPPGQRASETALYSPMVYDLAPRALKSLRDVRGTAVRNTPSGSAWFPHQLMQACVGASFELTARTMKAIRYVSRDEYLRSEKCPSRDEHHPLSIKLRDGSKLVPDDLFALENPEGKKRVFIVEIDRATESIKPRDIARIEKTTYFGEKLDKYVRAFDEDAFRSRWGVAKPHILIVTTSPDRARRIFEETRGKRHLADIAISIVPDFGTSWRVPKNIWTHLLKKPWATLKGERDICAP